MSSTDDTFELLAMGYDESEICWDCGHVMGGGYLPGRFTPDCQGDDCECETCAEECGDHGPYRNHSSEPRLQLVEPQRGSVLPDNLLRSSEEAAQLPKERSRSFMLGTHMDQEAFNRIGPYDPNKKDDI